ncbi:MAG: LysE family transporter [Alphaproteobacteria bacterium]|nr:LysE family transporter [Alphaproteobacteria bacterium]
MDFANGLAFCLGIQALAMLVPGQNHFMLLSMSSAGRLALVMTVLGIASAGVIFSTGVILSIWFGGQAVSDLSFTVLSLMGALYLVYLGSKLVGIFVSRFKERLAGGGDASTPAVALEAGKGRRWPAAFRSGFLVNISNSKSALFFASIFSTTLPLADLAIPYLAVAVIAFFLNSVLFHGMVAGVFMVPRVRDVLLHYNLFIQLIAGSVFLVFGSVYAYYAVATLLAARPLGM